MNNSTINKLFLNGIDSKTRACILKNIANHYGISTEAALEEVLDPDAEHLLDYVTGPERNSVSVLMANKVYF
jgi:hypothetical protein